MTDTPPVSMRAHLLNREGDLRRRFPAHFRPDPRTRLAMMAGLAGALGLYVFGLVVLDFSPAAIIGGIGRLGEMVALMLPPDPETWDKALLYARALAETLAIAFLGTLLGATFALPLGLLAARNVVASRIVHALSRRGLDTIRGVDTLIWALIWINVVGLGPFAGVLAIMCSDIGSFGKLFSEAIEATDRRPVEGVASSGGSAMQQVRFGIIPQVLPVMASQVLYYFESNSRSATIIGIVGAGGIGLHLAEQIRTLEWQQVSFLVLMILVAVGIIDWISSRLRFAVIGSRTA
jgi:phosphonate transport system permease protein